MLSFARAHELFTYCPETGDLRWKCSRSKVPAGSLAGRVWQGRNPGPAYRHVKVDYREYRVHRVIWLMMTGTWPAEFIDHKDGDSLNNRWDNLREATRSQNSANAKMPRTNSLGFKGVYQQRGTKNFTAQITINKRSIFLGSYATPEEAHAAYVAAAQRLFGDFARAE